MLDHRLGKAKQVGVISAAYVETAAAGGQVEDDAQVTEPQVGVDQQRVQRIQRRQTSGQVFMTATEENWPRELAREAQRWVIKRGTLERALFS